MGAYQRTVDNYYLQQAKGAPYFQGPAYQRGHGLGGIFRALMRIATPIFRTAVPAVKAGAAAVAKDAIRTGAHIAQDALLGRDLGESMEQRSKEAAAHLINRGTGKLISMLDTGPKLPQKRIKAKRRAVPKKRRKDIFS